MTHNHLSAPAGDGADPVVLRQQAEWAEQVDAIRGSDLDSRKLRLSCFLRGFAGAYSWTRCTPAGDLDAILALSTQATDREKVLEEALDHLIDAIDQGIMEEPDNFFVALTDARRALAQAPSEAGR